MNKSIWIAVVVLAVLGIGAFFVLGQNSNKQSDQAVSTPTPDLSTTTTMEETSAPASDSTNSATSGTVKEFTVAGSPFKFDPSTLKVKMGDHVKITFRNLQGRHDFVIDELGVKAQTLTTPNAEEVVEFVASKAGSFKYYCSVPGHRAQGMEGTLVVE